jgi:alkylation response protein AidB-like acyl-CoA dehydrogenase
VVDESLQDADGVRSTAKRWIDENFSPDLAMSTWLELLSESGWAVSQWPQPFGKGLTVDLARVAYAEFDAVETPGPPLGLGVTLAAPTLLGHATQAQLDRYLPQLLAGHETWCQLFSEPGAGSDLAGLSTTAVLDGDEYVVNGQKVWTSLAVGADFGMLLARTNPGVPKRRGISWFILPMNQPGVEVRPLRQITGDDHFAEVFFTNARVPAANIVGDLDDGWSVAGTTLANERAGLGGTGSPTFAIRAAYGEDADASGDLTVAEYVAQAKARPKTYSPGTPMTNATLGAASFAKRALENGASKSPMVRERIARLYALQQVNAWNSLRARAAREAGEQPGPAGSIGKLMMTRIIRASRDTGMAVFGPQGMLTEEDGPNGGGLGLQYLGAPSASIYGGSDEIQRNIIGERVLGLPREPDASQNVPFNEMRVGTQT